MPAKIRLSELIRRIEDKELTDKEYKRYFDLDKARGTAFRPEIRLRKSAVDSRGLSATMEQVATALAHDAVHGMMEAEIEDRGEAKVLAEGDSWFDLPWFYSTTIIDQLNKNHFSVDEIANAGDTLEDMIASKEYLHALKQKSYKVFMFSGGGNDVLGNLEMHLDQRESGDNDAANAPRYIRSNFNDTLDRVCAHYDTMLTAVKKHNSRIRIVVHGYGYAIAEAGTEWPGVPFDKKGFHPVYQADMCYAIVRAMVDAFNLRLQQLAQNHGKRVIYMDFRKDMKKRDWWDELHPRPRAARKLADKIATEIEPYV